MSVTYEMIDDILIAILSGELDHHTIKEIRKSIDRTFDTFYARHLILSFGKVSFMDSSGVGLVMGRYNKTKSKQGSLSVVGLSEHVDRVFDMAAIYTIAKRCQTVEDAIREIRTESEGE